MTTSSDDAVPIEQIRGELNPDAILAAATADTGLSDYGDYDVVEPLSRLLSGVIADLPLAPMGLVSFKAFLHRILINRLRFQRDLDEHPEILDEDVSDPIIIVGMPRTGTTKLQRMMSADPNVQAAHTWRLLNPAPFPGAVRGQPDPRIEPAKHIEAMMNASSSFRAMHEFKAVESDEDSFLLLFTLEYSFVGILWPSTTYIDWVRSRDRRPAYRYQKKLLQYLQWQDGGRKGRRWILKNPGHLGALDVLLETYPKAVLVKTKRNVVDAMPSFCRLMEPAILPNFSGMSSRDLGRQSMDFWTHEMKRYADIRATMGSKLNMIDAPF